MVLAKKKQSKQIRISVKTNKSSKIDLKNISPKKTIIQNNKGKATSKQI